MTAGADPALIVPTTSLPATGIVVAGSDVRAVTVTAPRVMHRIEVVHGSLRADSPAAALAGLLSPLPLLPRG
jgi:hypothetical protein